MSNQQQQYTRFTVPQRVEHVILLLSFTILALTGLPQKYSTSEISQAIINLFGGIESTRIIHRVAATIFVLQAVYHFAVAGYKIYVRRLEASMVPTIKDARDAAQAFTHNLGLSKEAPKMPRYNFMEKAEYWAMIWGLVLMALTGFMLWNPIITARFLPGVFIPAAKAAHGAEALLAVLAIILWHFYNVHIKSWNPSIFTGAMTREQMAHEHGAELEKIESGQAVKPASDAAGIARRRSLYIPVATIVSLLLLGGIIWLITAEDTAIATVPPLREEGVPVYSPRGTATAFPATATPANQAPAAAQPTTGAAQPTGAAPAAGAGGTAATWNGGIGTLFQSKCAGCHGSMGGYTVDTYANAVKGGASGQPAIVPGDPAASRLVEMQQAGHMGQFTAEELQQVIDWITAGAPES